LYLKWLFRAPNLEKLFIWGYQTVDKFITPGERTGGDCCIAACTVEGLQKLEYPLEEELGIPEECCWVFRTIEELGTLQYPTVQELGTV